MAEEQSRMMKEDHTLSVYRLYCRERGKEAVRNVQDKAPRTDGAMILCGAINPESSIQWTITAPVDTVRIFEGDHDEEGRPLKEDEWEAIVAPWCSEEWRLFIGSSDEEDWRFAAENSRVMRPQATVREVLTAVYDMVAEIPGFVRELVVGGTTFLPHELFEGFVWRGEKGREATIRLGA